MTHKAVWAYDDTRCCDKPRDHPVHVPPPKYRTLLLAIVVPYAEDDPDDLADDVVGLANRQRVLTHQAAAILRGEPDGPLPELWEVSAIPAAQWMTSETMANLRAAAESPCEECDSYECHGHPDGTPSASHTEMLTAPMEFVLALEEFVRGVLRDATGDDPEDHLELVDARNALLAHLRGAS